MNENDIVSHAADIAISQGKSADPPKGEAQVWIAASEDHHIAYVHARHKWVQVHEALSSLRRNRPDSPDELIARIRTARERSARDDATPSTWRTLRSHPRWVVATACAILLACLAGHALLSAWPTQTGAEYVGKFDRPAPIALPDQSILYLDKGSVARVVMTSRLRSVELPYGRAFFRVHHENNRPFDVSVGEAVIRATGTEFSVKNVAGHIEAFVKEGGVDIYPQGVDSTIPATPLPINHAAIIEHDSVTPRRLTPAEAISELTWWSGDIWVEGSLAEVVNRFSEHNPRKIRIEDPSMRSLYVAGPFNPAQLDSFLALLARLDIEATTEVDSTSGAEVLSLHLKRDALAHPR